MSLIKVAQLKIGDTFHPYKGNDFIVEITSISPYGTSNDSLIIGHDKDQGCPIVMDKVCLLYTSPSPRDRQKSRMPSSA